MDHLSVEEIIDFVSISELDGASLELASRVNSHILKCPECLRKVEAFGELYEAFTNGKGLWKRQGIGEKVALSEAIKNRAGLFADPQDREPELEK